MHWRKTFGVKRLYAKKGFFLGFVIFTYWALFVLPFGFYLWYEYMVRTSHVDFALILRAQFLPPVLCLVHGIIHGPWLYHIEKENKNYQRLDLSIYVKSIMRP